MTEKKTNGTETEHKFTFECMITEVDRVETRIRAYCFEHDIAVNNFLNIGGFIKERTYGVEIKGPKKEITEFKTWWKEHEKDLCDTRSMLGALIRDHLS